MSEVESVLPEGFAQLPFSETKQNAVLGHLLKDDRFFMQASSRIEPEWFINTYCNKVFAAKKEFYQKYKRCPTNAELKETPRFLGEDQATRNRMNARIDLCLLESVNFGLDAIVPDLTDWLHARIYHEMVHKSSGLFNKQKLSDAFTVMRERLTQIERTTFNNDNEVSYDDIRSALDQYVVDQKGALTFGLSAMDRLLVQPVEENGKIVNSGGLLPGDSTVLMAATNVGKTSCMFTVAAHNIMRGKSVLLVTHEDTDDALRLKMVCTLLQCSLPQLFKKYETPEGRACVQLVNQRIKENLTHIHMARAGLTVEEVGTVIRRKQDERAARAETKFRGFDLLVNDYPALLTTQQALGGKWEKRHVTGDVYNYFVMLAAEYKFHGLYAIQTNREGSKINRHDKGFEDRLVKPENVAECWDAICIADNVISMNRDGLAEANEYLTYYIGKCRSNRKDWAVLCKSDYAHGVTHDDRLGCTWYPGNNSMANRVDTLLQQYGKPGEGQAVPLHEIAMSM